MHENRSRGYACLAMRTTPEIQEKLLARLEQAKKQANNSAEQLGKMLGWANGGYVRQFLGGKRKITSELIIRANESKEVWLHGWFDGILPPLTKADVATAQVTRLAKTAWPFERLKPEEWEALGTKGRWLVEDAAVTKARELLKEFGRSKPQRKTSSRP